jgi:hypothetical protein
MALLGATGAACSSGDELGTSSEELRSGGSWSLPDDVRAAGANVNVRYDDAPSWTGHCPNDGLTPGARILGNYLQQQFGQVTEIGGFSCRPNTANTSQTSVHGTGRALDVMTDDGDDIANWAVMNAQQVNIQLIIWNHTIWRANGRQDGPYGGPNPHTDHVHIEINEDAANQQTPWFQNPGASVGVPPRTDPQLPPINNPNDPNNPTAGPIAPTPPMPPILDPPINPNPYPTDPNYPGYPNPNPYPAPTSTGPSGPTPGPIPTLPNGSPSANPSVPTAPSASARPPVATPPPPAAASPTTAANDLPAGTGDSLGTGVRAPTKKKNKAKAIEGGCAVAPGQLPSGPSSSFLIGLGLALMAAVSRRSRR